MSLVTTQHIKGITKMKRHMRARKEEENGMEINKGMRRWPVENQTQVYSSV